MITLTLNVVLLGVLAGLWPKFGSDPLAEAFPMEASGDFHFQADVARFLEEGQPVAEVALSIPEEGLGNPADSARLEIVMEILDGKANAMAAYKTLLSIPPPDPISAGRKAFPVPRRWLRLTADWMADASGLKLHLEDTEHGKVGLLDRLRDKGLSGEVAGRVSGAGRRVGPEAWMSDLLFVWGPAEGSPDIPPGTGLRAVRARLEPNPYRYYGLYQPILSIYWERYLPPGDGGPALGAPLLARGRILRLSDSLEVHATTETLRVEKDPKWTIKRFDLSELEAGSYRCQIALMDLSREPARVLASAGGDFQVVWERATWTLDEDQLLTLARVLLPSTEFERFETLDRGAMETYMRQLWNRLSPASPGEENPIERKFVERVRYATANFGGTRPGIVSDRGRVFVRYGPPDEIRREPNPQDQDLLWIVMPQEVDAEGTEDLTALQRLSRRRTPIDNRAYEIWEYDTWGDPLLPEYVNPGQKHGLKYIFVDEHGTGDLTLTYTSVPASLQ